MINQKIFFIMLVSIQYIPGFDVKFHDSLGVYNNQCSMQYMPFLIPFTGLTHFPTALPFTTFLSFPESIVFHLFVEHKQ